MSEVPENEDILDQLDTVIPETALAHPDKSGPSGNCAGERTGQCEEQKLWELLRQQQPNQNQQVVPNNASGSVTQEQPGTIEDLLSDDSQIGEDTPLEKSVAEIGQPTNEDKITSLNDDSSETSTKKRVLQQSNAFESSLVTEPLLKRNKPEQSCHDGQTLNARDVATAASSQAKEDGQKNSSGVHAMGQVPSTDTEVSLNKNGDNLISDSNVNCDGWLGAVEDSNDLISEEDMKESELSKLREALEKEAKLKKELVQRNEDLEQRNVVLEQRNVGLEQRNVGLEQRNVGLEQRNVGLEQRNVGLEQRNVGLEQRNVGLEQRNVVLEQRNVGLEQRNVGLEQRNVGLEQRNVGLEEQVQHYKDRCKIAEAILIPLQK